LFRFLPLNNTRKCFLTASLGSIVLICGPSAPYLFFSYQMW
jgi:hypothetical protein